MLLFLKSAFLILIIISTGDVINRLFWDKEKNFSTRVSLAWGLGTGTIGICLFCLSYFGLQLSTISVFIVPAFLISVFVLLKKPRLFTRPLLHNPFSLPLKQDSKRNYFFIVLIIASLALIFFKALFFPMHLPDDRTQWGAKAKIIYHDKTIHAETFNDPYRAQLHIGYPFLIPMLEASFYLFIEKVDDCLVKIFFPLYFTGLLFFLYSSQRRYASHSHSLLFTAMFSVLPVFIQDVRGCPSSGYVDIPLTFYYTVSVISLFNWFESSRFKDFMLAIIFISFAIFTKQEGLMLWFAALIGIWAKMLFGNKKDPINKYTYLVMFIVLPFVVLIPWFQFRNSLNLPYVEKDWSLSHINLEYILSNLYRIPLILEKIIEACFLLDSWNILWILFVAVIILCAKITFRFPLIFILFLILFNLSALFGAVLLYPWVWWTNFLFDVPRLLIINIPLIVFFISYALSKSGLFEKGRNIAVKA